MSQKGNSKVAECHGKETVRLPSVTERKQQKARELGGNFFSLLLIFFRHLTDMNNCDTMQRKGWVNIKRYFDEMK